MGRGVRLQIFTRDPRRAARLYAEVFGWSLPADGDRCCWVITTGDDSRLGIDSADTDGNLITVMQDDRRAHWPHPRRLAARSDP